MNVERVTFPAMVSDGSLYAFDGDTYWIDAGTPRTYLAANLDLISGLRGLPEAGVHAGATVAGVVEGSVIGDRALVEQGATVTGSVLLPGAIVRRGAVVRDAVVGPGATIEVGAIIEDGAVIGDDVVVSARARVSDRRLPEDAT